MSFKFYSSADKRKYNISTELKNAHINHGISPVQQLKDIFFLGRSPSKLSDKDYYILQLYTSDLYPIRESFIGDTFRAHMQKDYLDKYWFGVGMDKLTLYGLLKAHNLAFPQVQGVVHAFRTWPDASAINTLEMLEHFLINTARYPLFGKPVGEVSSIGTISIEGYDAATRHLQLYGGETYPLESFWEETASFREDGYLFQTRATTHPQIQERVGMASSTLRVMIALTAQGPEVWRCTWKVPAGENYADNYARPGNIIVAVDPETGITQRALQSSEKGRIPVQTHPDTGAALEGVQLPDWEAAMDLCKKAACNAYYGGKLQGWDILLSDAGPVIIELEPDGGGPTLSQIAQRKGLLEDKKFMEHLKWAAKDRLRKHEVIL